jgi:hypothetical protein
MTDIPESNSLIHPRSKQNASYQRALDAGKDPEEGLLLPSNWRNDSRLGKRVISRVFENMEVENSIEKEDLHYFDQHRENLAKVTHDLMGAVHEEAYAIVQNLISPNKGTYEAVEKTELKVAATVMGTYDYFKELGMDANKAKCCTGSVIRAVVGHVELLREEDKKPFDAKAAVMDVPYEKLSIPLQQRGVKPAQRVQELVRDFGVDVIKAIAEFAPREMLEKRGREGMGQRAELKKLLEDLEENVDNFQDKKRGGAIRAIADIERTAELLEPVKEEMDRRFSTVPDADKMLPRYKAVKELMPLLDAFCAEHNVGTPKGERSR